MRYRLSSGVEIRTENAAKPAAQPSKFLLNVLSELPKAVSSFDYGCGKLRYLYAMLEATDRLTLIDSETQISRAQILWGKTTSIRKLFIGSNSIDVCNPTEFEGANTKYQRGFCINVLSAIPSDQARYEALALIREKLSPEGQCLFVVQYQNSDFTRMRAMGNSMPWLDGFIIASLRGHSFYGIIAPDRLKTYLLHAGFTVRDSKLNQGSAYFWAAIA